MNNSEMIDLRMMRVKGFPLGCYIVSRKKGITSRKFKARLIGTNPAEQV